MKQYPEYRDSGIEWIGIIPKHWRTTKLRYIGDAIIGLTYSPEEIAENGESGTLVLRASNIQDDILSLNDSVFIKKTIPDELIVRKGDILICSRSGSKELIGKNICIDENMEGYSFGAFMVVFRSQYWLFLAHVFKSALIKSQSSLYLTTTINQLTNSTLKNFVVTIPPENIEQSQIASFLDHKTRQIDDLIAKNQKLIELLLEERIALINQAVTKGLDPSVPMKDSGIEWLGEIPKHWGIGKFYYYIKLRHGFQFRDADFTEDGIKIVKITQLNKNGYLDLSSCSFIDDRRLDSFSDILIKQNDILMCLTGGTIGKIIRVGEVNEPLLQNYRVGHFSSRDSDKMINDFIFWLMTSDVIKEQIFYFIRETGQPNIGMEDFTKMVIQIPSIDDQLEISIFLQQKTSKINESINKINKEIELLNEYKTALINEAVTGKIDVRDYQINHA